jgi:tetratricopeptide (TPR) repeat protein
VKLAKFLEKKGDAKSALQECILARQWNMPGEDIAHCGEIQKRLCVEVTFIARDFSHATSVPPPVAEVTTSAPISHPPITLKQGEPVESAWEAAYDNAKRKLEIGQWAEALKPGETAAALAEQLKPVDYRMMKTFDLLGDIYYRAGRLADSKAAVQRELDLTVQALGPQSAQNQRPISALAIIAVGQKDYATAETLYLRLLDNFEKNYDPIDLRISSTLIQVGEFYEFQKAYEKAEPYLLHAYEIGKRADGDVGPVIEDYAAILRRFYISWGKFDKAEPYCRKVLSLREENYGRNSRAVADSIQTLADVLDKLGKKDEAAGLRKRSEAILGTGIPPKQQ